MPNTIAVQITAQGPGPDDLAKAKAGGEAIATAAGNGTKQVQTAVQQLGNTFTSGLSPLQKFAQGLERLDAREATRGMFALRTGLQGLALQAVGTSGPLAKIGESLLAFGAGGAVGLAALAGIGLIGKAWEAVTASAREAQAAQDKAIAHLAEVRAGAVERGRGGPDAADERTVRTALAETERKIMHERLVIAHPEAVVDEHGAATGFSELQGAPERLAALEQKAADLRRDLNAIPFNKVGEEGAAAAKTVTDAMKALTDQTAAYDAVLRALAENHGLGDDAIAAENVARAYDIAILKATGLSEAQAEAALNTKAMTQALQDEVRALETIARFGPEVERAKGVTMAPIAFPTPRTRIPEPEKETDKEGGTGTGAGAGFGDLQKSLAEATDATERFAASLARTAANALLLFAKAPGPGTALAAGSQVLSTFAERRFTAQDQLADPSKVAGTLVNPGLALPATILSIGAGLIEGFKSFFSSSQNVITIGGYTPAALAQLRELSGSGTLVAINSAGGGTDLATLQYQLNRRSRQDGVTRIPVTTPGAGNS